MLDIKTLIINFGTLASLSINPNAYHVMTFGKHEYNMYTKHTQMRFQSELCSENHLALGQQADRTGRKQPGL